MVWEIIINRSSDFFPSAPVYTFRGMWTCFEDHWSHTMVGLEFRLPAMQFPVALVKSTNSGTSTQTTEWEHLLVGPGSLHFQPGLLVPLSQFWHPLLETSRRYIICSTYTLHNRTWNFSKPPQDFLGAFLVCNSKYLLLYLSLFLIRNLNIIENLKIMKN